MSPTGSVSALPSANQGCTLRDSSRGGVSRAQSCSSSSAAAFIPWFNRRFTCIRIQLKQVSVREANASERLRQAHTEQHRAKTFIAYCSGLSHFLMSLFPAVVLATTLSSYVPLRDGVQDAMAFLCHVMPQRGESMSRDIVRRIGTRRTGLLSIALVTTGLRWEIHKQLLPRYT